MKGKIKISVGDTVTIGDTEWAVVERDGFMVGLVPTHSAPSGQWRTQYADVSIVKKAGKQGK